MRALNISNQSFMLQRRSVTPASIAGVCFREICVVWVLPSTAGLRLRLNVACYAAMRWTGCSCVLTRAAGVKSLAAGWSLLAEPLTHRRERGSSVLSQLRIVLNSTFKTAANGCSSNP